MSQLAAICACLVSFIWMSLPALAAELDFRAAWGGIATQSAFTELTVGIRSSEPGTFSLEFPGQLVNTRAKLNVPQAERAEFSLPYPLSKPGPIEWILRKDGAVVATGHENVFSRVARHTWDIDLVVSSQDPRTANVLSAMLPTRTQAYDSIRSITLTPRNLRSLTSEQLQAFQEYMLRCGRVVLLDSTAELLSRLKQFSGCGGRHVHSKKGNFLPKELPGANDVHSLLACRDCGGSLNRLTALLTIYAILLLVAGLSGRAKTVMVLSVAASLVMYIANRTNEAHVTWLSWSQADATALFQTRQSVLVVEGQGRSEFTVPLLGTSIPQLPLPKGTTLTYNVSRSGSIAATLTLPSGYLTRDVLSFVDTGPLEEPLIGQAAGSALTVEKRIEQKNGFTLDLRAQHEAIKQPATGIHAQWHATVAANGKVPNDD